MKEIRYKDRDEWLSLRRQYIGGSDAAAAIGMSQWKSPFALWCEKTGRTEEFTGNLTTQVGAYLEDFVAQMFSEQTGKKVRKKNSILLNDAYPFACADVDRLIVGERALLEIKTTNSVPLMRAIRKDKTEFPDAYYAQVVHYLAVTGLDKAYLAVLVNCRELVIYELERDEDEIRALMEAEAAFWRHVEDDAPPETDGSDSTAAALDELYPESGEGEITLFGLEGDLTTYMQIKDQLKALKGMQTEIENRIKACMGDAERAGATGFRVSWKSQSARRFDAAAFAADHGDMDLTPYYKETTSRYFRIKQI